MKVFISWSGDQSREIADIIHKWLPATLQATKPYFSPDDVSKRVRWSTDLFSELNDCHVGLIIITPENQASQWLMFESGALAKNLVSSKVAPLVFGMDMADLTGPLAHFQAAVFDKQEMLRVVKMINSELGDRALDAGVLQDVFNMWWPRLEEKINAALKNVKAASPKPERTEKDILDEILLLTRSASRSQNAAGGIGAEPFEHIVRLAKSMSLQNRDDAILLLSELESVLSFMANRILSPEEASAFNRSYSRMLRSKMRETSPESRSRNAFLDVLEDRKVS